MQPHDFSSPALVKANKRKKLALWLMLGPAGLLITTFLLFALINLLFFSTADAGNFLFPSAPPYQSFIVFLLFITAAVSFLAFVPGLIIGIVLLIIRK
jgi:hypothetical protein